MAAAALSYLTGDFTDASDDNIRDIKAEGGIEPLVELLKSESAEAQAHAASVLSDITRIFRRDVASGSAIELLVEQITNDSSSDIKAEAAGALWSISGGLHETQSAIAKQGAIQPLVTLLGDADMRTRRKAAGALTSLAIGNHANQDAISQAKGIPPLVDLLSSQYKSSVQMFAAGCLAELARNHPKNQAAIAKAGCIAPLVDLLKADDPPESAAEEAVAEEAGGASAKEEAAGAMWTLSASNTMNQNAIAEAGGIAPLVMLLDSPSPRAQEKAAGALSARP